METVLNDTWTWWAHDPADENWGIDSYKSIADIRTVSEYIQASQTFQSLLTRGMHFMMRSHIKPIWEAPENRAGGCLSIKIMKHDVPEAWFELGARLLGETLLKDASAAAQINGISISPKRSYCIFRIWVADPALSSIGLMNFGVPAYSGVIFKRHIESDDSAAAAAAQA